MDETAQKFYNLVHSAYIEALRNGIKANTIIINENMVEVSSFAFRTPIGSALITPTMYCGLNVHFTKEELPENYSFAILEAPHSHDRLSQFEAIGMEPEELKKAAEVYRRIKDLL